MRPDACADKQSGTHQTILHTLTGGSDPAKPGSDVRDVPQLFSSESAPRETFIAPYSRAKVVSLLKCRVQAC